MAQAQKSLANAQTSLSLRQVADRLGVDISEVKECIKTGALAAHVLLSDALVLHRGVLGEFYELPSPSDYYEASREQHEAARRIRERPKEYLNGCYRLPTKEAVAVLTGRLQDRPIPGVLEVIADEPDQSAVIGSSEEEFPTSGEEFRVLSEDLERFERKHSIGEMSAEQKFRPSRLDEVACCAAAAVLWKLDHSLTIPAMERRLREDLPEHTKEWQPGTVEGWIRKLCPNRRPGRRPVPKPPSN
jgi:hypothetical protein